MMTFDAFENGRWNAPNGNGRDYTEETIERVLQDLRKMFEELCGSIRWTEEPSTVNVDDLL